MDIKREIQEKLLQWKNAPNKKPLLLKGARQVGKTHSLIKFGQTQYADKGHQFHYLDFKKSPKIHSIFEETLDPLEIIRLLQFHFKRKIVLDKDLLIFDEVQECPDAITSLKYFEQDIPSLDMICAGSHLGLIKPGVSFPVGKTNYLHMYPLHFHEFLGALAPDLHDELTRFTFKAPIPAIVHNMILDIFTSYIFTGGLPEVVTEYISSDYSIDSTRKKQKELLNGYRADFSKYAGRVNATHIQHVFDSIPGQLSQTHESSSKKYRFKGVIPNRKGFDVIRGPLRWLDESKLCIKALIIKKAEHPFQSYSDENKFKVFFFDIGLLNCMLDIPGETILANELGRFKGYLLENFVAQEMYRHQNSRLYSWQEGTAELEFIWNGKTPLIPIEVKSARRSRRAKSLDAYIKRYNPPAAYKLSIQNYGHDSKRKITTLPIYCIGRLVEQL